MTQKELIQGFVGKYRTEVILVIFSGVVASLLNVIIPLSIGGFFELVFHEGGSKSRLLEMFGLKFGDLNHFFLFFFFLILARGIAGFTEHYLSGMAREKLTAYLRETLFQSQLKHTIQSFNSNPISKYLTRYGNDMLAIQNYFVKGRWKASADFVFFLFAFALLVSLSMMGGLLVASSYVVAVFVFLLLNPLQRDRSEKKKNSRSALFQFVELRLKVFRTLKIFNRQVPELRQFQKLNAKVIEAGRKDVIVGALIQSLLPVFFFGILAVVLMHISGSTQSTDASSTMLVFVLLMLYMQGAFKRVLKLPTVWLQGNSSLKGLIEMLNLKEEVQPERDAKISFRERTITLDHIVFSYTPGQIVIHNFSAIIESGKTTLIEGHGKSTLLRLILALEQPQSGTIRIGGTDCATLSPHDVRRQMTYVGPEAPLIGNTVCKAVSYSRAEENRSEVAEMLVKVAFHPDSRSDDLLNFKLEPEARNLSSSERKKLQVARALLTGKKILLLDEPFADLDQNSKEVLLNLLRGLHGKITLVIATNDIPKELIIDQRIRL